MQIRDGLSPELARMARVVADPKPILEAMGTGLVSLATRSFNEPGVRAAPWPPLRPATIAAKIKAGKSTAVLKRNLVLARSWRVAELSGERVTVATDRPYAAVHQFGSKQATGRGSGIPQRAMLPFTGTNPDTAQLVPWARERLQKIGQAKLATLLR